MHRLPHDTRSILDNQLHQVETASRECGDGRLDLEPVTDGLRAEGEQGITIGVAYRFATRERSFILADAPGHVRYLVLDGTRPVTEARLEERGLP